MKPPLVSIPLKRHSIHMGIEINSTIMQRQSPQTDTTICEWPGCEDPGLCRAPKSRQELRNFRWFCKTHVRQYNLSWNYYAGMTDEEVEDDVRHDTTWQRPSWRLGSTNRRNGGLNPENIMDAFNLIHKQGFFHEKGTSPKNDGYLSEEQKSALSVFQLSSPVSEKIVKTRYKKLVKIHHPDAVKNNRNQTDSVSGERIKDINQAYQVLLNLLAQ